MCTDLTPLIRERLNMQDFETCWTIALVRTDATVAREVHFGVFSNSTDAREAMESGRIQVRPDERLELRRIRQFPEA